MTAGASEEQEADPAREYPPMQCLPLHRPSRLLLPILIFLLSLGGWDAAGAVPVEARVEIRGTVLTPGGAGQAGVTVRLEPVLDDRERGLRALAGHDGPEAVDEYRTREDGGFLLVAPGPGMWRVVMEAPGRVPVERRLVPIFEDTTLPAAQLPEDAGMTVTVVDPEGRPVPGAWVTGTTAATSPVPGMVSEGGWSLPGATGTTGAGGRVHLPRDENQVLVVRAWAPAYLPSETTTASDSGPVTLQLLPGQERVLRVRDPAGQSLPDVLVTLAESGVALGTTDVEGRLAAVLPDSGLVKLVVDAGGGWRQRPTLDPKPTEPKDGGEPDDDTLEVTLGAPVLLTGRVVDSEGGSPLAGALVWPRGEPGAAVVSGEEGAYEMIAGAPPEEVAGAAAGFRVAAVRPEDARAGRVPELRLPPEVVLAGTVSDAAGEPVPGARIRLRTPAHPGLTWDRGFGGESPGATSDEQGRFRAAGLDAGSVYLLRVEAAGFAELEQPVEPPARLALVLERGGGLAGTVTDPYAAPVAGARVRLFSAPDESERLVVQVRDGEQLAEHETHTGADGGFVLDTVAAGTYDLRVDAAGLAPLRRMGVEVPRGELLDLGRLVAEQAVAVAGRVVDGEGEPVAGARVSVNLFSPYRGWRGSRSVYVFSSDPSAIRQQVGGVVTDDEGRFRLGGLAAGELVDLDVDHPRHRARKVDGVEPPADDLEIELDAGVRVTGRVLDASGRPVASAQVRLQTESEVQTSGGQSRFSSNHAAITDEEGRFDEAGLAPGTLSVEAMSGDLSPAAAGPFTTESGDLIGPLELVLGEPVELAGTLYGLDGDPVPGVLVEAQRAASTDSRTRTGRRSARTGPAGRYRFHGLPAGEYEVSAQAGAARAEATVVIGEESLRLDLQMEDHRALTGRVVRADGGPAVEPELRVHPLESDGDAPAVTLRGAEDGSFAWSDPPVGAHRIVATAGEERGVVDVDVGRNPPRDLLVQLRPGAEVRGMIDGVEPSEVHRVQVSASPSEGGRLRFGRTGHRGDYRVGGLTPGAWKVSAVLPGVGRAEDEVEVSGPGESVMLDLELTGGTRVSGRVTLDGEPAAGAHVEFTRIGAEPSLSRHTNALHDGTFRIAGLEAGRYQLRVAGDFAAPRWLREVDLTGDEELYLDLEAVEVSGRVLAPDGAPVAGARVSLGPPGDDRGQFSTVVLSDELGLFRLPEVLPGSYVLAVRAPGFEPVETPLQVDVLDVGGLEVVLGR